MYRFCFKIILDKSCPNANLVVQGILGAIFFLFSTRFLVTVGGLWGQLLSPDTSEIICYLIGAAHQCWTHYFCTHAQGSSLL